ncbi:uncharacterized protein STAUR_0200 [Stigmatella aurantiaca DW4/3-1]|uniref:Uncharacterized protein n=2 Tax=Stigmatella aurantiaca TaxID=41 RepID=E3FM05_STIAD|nr:uncharacterized protein STAUR_0200 [Stigmatella aurantiaca DW4/3-1]
MVQYPKKIELQMEQLQKDLLHDRYFPREEKQRLKAQGFFLGVDHAMTRSRMLEFLSVADFDFFVFYIEKTLWSGREDELRTELLRHLLRDRLPSPRWPIETICGDVEKLYSRLSAVGAGLRAEGWKEEQLPVVLAPKKAWDFNLLVVQYASDIVRTRLEQIMAGPPFPPQPYVDHFRTKLRMVEHMETGKRFHRKCPLP